jgi:hypothetical protein
MTTLREAAQQALEALEYKGNIWHMDCPLEAAITALKAALEQPEQEPVAWIQSNHLQLAQRGPFSCRVEPTQRHPDFVPLYTHPPRRKPLSNEELDRLWREPMSADWEHREFARAVEAAHGIKEKNHD